MTRTARAVTIAETLSLPAMKLLASLNVLFLVSFLVVSAMAVDRAGTGGTSFVAASAR